MLGYDILVFTNAVNHMPHFLENAYADGEENIYRLIQKAELDGVLFAAGRFHDSAVIEKIAKLLKQVKCPCLVMEKQHSSFPFIYMPQRDGIRQLTEHLITEHGCRRLFCLTGYKGMYESEERLQGFCEALIKHGIPIRQEDIFYGDFWKESAKLLKSTSLTVQEIAEQCGYQDTFHFIRQFKAKVGMTAAKFRDDSGQC